MPRPDAKPAARLPDGRALFADLDPDRADSPLRRALRAAAFHRTNTPETEGEPGEEQPGQTPERAPR